MKPHFIVTRFIWVIALLAASTYTVVADIESLGPKKNESEIMFEAKNGEMVSAFRGWLEVPENRKNIKSRKIKLNYVRFPATTDKNANASPIVYLAGGPGGSGIETAKHRRFPLFMAM